MPIQIGTAGALSKRFLGTQEIDKVYLGASLIWQRYAPPAFSAQRMNKSGNFSLSGTMQRVTGWTSDSSEPATITSNELNFTTTATANAQITCYINKTGVNSLSGSATGSLRVNGTEVASGTTASGTTGNATLTWTGTLSASDKIALWANRSNGTVNLVAGTYIRVEPI